MDAIGYPCWQFERVAAHPRPSISLPLLHLAYGVRLRQKKRKTYTAAFVYRRASGSICCFRLVTSLCFPSFVIPSRCLPCRGKNTSRPPPENESDASGSL